MVNPPFDHSALEEERKWIELSRKDIHHFQPLYEKYYQPIFRFIFRRTDDEMLTADLCSQTFYKALTKIRSFQWQGKPLAAWLYRIAGNEVKRHYRDRKEVFVIEEDKILEVPELREEWLAINTENLTNLLNDLEDDDLQLIELKYFEGHTFQEIAMLMDMKESRVKMRIYRLLKKLKKRLEEHYVKI